MKIIRIILQIGILYAFYYIGVFIVHLTSLPLPASVIGLIILAVALQLQWIKLDYIREGASFLIAFMTLFFIPPMLGIIEYPELFSVSGIILMSGVFVSTMFAIFITSIISQKIEEKEIAMKEEKGGKIIESSNIHH